MDKIKDNNKNKINSIKKDKNSHIIIKTMNNSSYIKNNSSHKKVYNIPSTYRDYISMTINNKKSRNHLNLKKKFNTNNKINNLTFSKEKKYNFNYLNNTLYSEKKMYSKPKLNLSYINKKKNNDLNHKIRIIKNKQNKENDKLSLKEKIHLFHQRKEELIKQYSNKNKVQKEDYDKNINKKIIFTNKILF